jgi:hypothetical protein
MRTEDMRLVESFEATPITGLKAILEAEDHQTKDSRIVVRLDGPSGGPSIDLAMSTQTAMDLAKGLAQVLDRAIV